MTYNPPYNPLVGTEVPGPLSPSRYLHISFHFSGSPLTQELIGTLLNQMAKDWLKYAGNCWIIYTQYDAVAWFNALRPYLKPTDQMIILELKTQQNVQGWLPKWIWDWIKKSRI